MTGEDDEPVNGDGEPGNGDDDSGDEGIEPERDPFGRLEESAPDRDGDPFEHLSGPDADGGVGRSDVGSGDGSGSRSATGGGEAVGDGTGGEPGDPGADVSPGGPAFDAVDSATRTGGPESRAGDPETRTGDPFSSPGSAFQRIDVGDVDDDDVWTAISEAEARGSVADVGERTYAEVSKHRFCETCEYFTGPPEVACTHEGTEILEFIDMETVRVVDCPIVEERRALQRGDDPST